MRKDNLLNWKSY